VAVWQVLVEQVWLGGQQFVEAERRVPRDAHSDDAQPEARHRIVVSVSVRVAAGELPDRRGDRFRCAWQPKPADLDPRQPEVVAMMEVLVRDLASLKRGKELLVGGGDARLSL
jgi:hypothetical protein